MLILTPPPPHTHTHTHAEESSDEESSSEDEEEEEVGLLGKRKKVSATTQEAPVKKARSDDTQSGDG